MAGNPETGEIYKAKAVTEDDVVAAVDAFMVDPANMEFLFADGYRIDVADAVSSEVNVTLLRQAVRYLLEQGAPIDLIGDANVPAFKMAGELVSANQVILRAYATGMVDDV